MRRNFIVSILLIFGINLFGQELLFQKELPLKSIFKDKRESLPVVNNENNELLLFLLDNSQINALKFGLNYELLDSYTTDRPANKLKELLGHSIDSNGYHLFFANEKKNEFYVKTMDVSGKKETGKLIPLELRDEKFLESISYHQKFYLLTIEKKSSVLNIYVFEGDAISRTEKLDLSSFKFTNTGYNTLFEALLDENNSPFQFDLKIQKIDIDNLNPLDITTKGNKLYYFNDKLYLTLDNSLSNTKLVHISLDDFSFKVDSYRQVKIDCGEVYKIKSNSYLFTNYLFQIKGCRNELCFQVTDLEKNAILKEYRVRHDDVITFKNTPLIQESSRQSSERELDDTKQILRKVSASDIGMSAKLSGENIELLIGGLKEVEGGGAGGGTRGMGSPGPTFSGAPAIYNYNTTMYGFNSYTQTRAVYFKSLFDKIEFNHISGNASNNAFDKIKAYLSDKKEDVSSETIFKIDNYYVFGYFNKRDKKYYLVKFED